MMFTHKFVVVTYPGGAGGYDHGHWTGHGKKKAAQACAQRVGGTTYRVKVKDNGEVRLTQVERN